MEQSEIKKIVVREVLNAGSSISAYSLYGTYHMLPVELMEAIEQLQKENFIQFDAQRYRIFITAQELAKAEDYIREDVVTKAKTTIEEKRNKKQLGLFEPYLPPSDIANEIEL